MTPRLRAAAETALIAAGLAGMAFVLDHHVIADAAERETMLTALLSDGRLLDTKFSLVGPLFAAPLWWLGAAIGGDTRPWIEQYNVALLALSMLAMYLLLRHRVEGGLLRAFFLVLIVASMFPAHVTGFNNETFTALAIAVGVAATLIRKAAVAGWAAITLGVANTPATLGGLALFAGHRVVAHQRWRYAVVPVAAATVIVAENWIRRDGPLVTGYEGAVGVRTVMPYSGLEGYSYPIFFGVLSLLLSFGKGLVFFAPGLFLPVRRSLRTLSHPNYDLGSLYWGWIVLLAGFVLAYAPWWAWYGGLTWGPRFLLFASVPASFALAVRLRDVSASLGVRLLTLVVLALSTWVGICAAVFPHAAFAEVCWRDNYAYEALCHYAPEFSVLWYPIVARLPVSTADWFVIAFCAGVASYLSAPLVRSVVADFVGHTQRRLRALDPRRWRF